MAATTPLFDKIGPLKLQAVIDDFVDRVYADTMIGFFFANFDRDRLKKHEFQFAATALGADIRYEGRPIRTAHAQHRIMGGQFNRRLTIFAETMRDHEVPDEIVQHLLAHTEKLRPLVTAQPAQACIHTDPGGALITAWKPPAKT